MRLTKNAHRTIMSAVLVVIAASCGGGTADTDTSVGDPAAEQASYERFDRPFHKSTASEYYAALYGGLLETGADGTRQIDTLVGGFAADSTEFHLLQQDPGLDLGRFMGVDSREGVDAKINRWFDRYVDGQSVVYVSAGLVAFDTHEHAVTAVRADLEKDGQEARETQANGGTEWLTAFQENGEGVTYLFWVPKDEGLIVSMVCVRQIVRTESSVCDSGVLRGIATTVIGRLPAAGSRNIPPGQFGPTVIPPGLTPLVAHEFDADHLAESYLDSEGTLRATWGEQPPAGTFPFTGRSTSYGFGNPVAGGAPMYVRIDEIPVGDTDAAVTFSSTICLEPDDSKNEYCGRETRHEASGSFHGGVTAVDTFDTLQAKPRQVRGHFAVGGSFVDARCSRALWWFEDKLTDDEVSVCTERMLALVRPAGGS